MSTPAIDPLRTRAQMRSGTTIEHVKVEPNGYVRRANLPIGKGFGDGSALYWVNLGWETAVNYDARIHKAKVEAEQAAAKAEAEAQAKAEQEETKAKGKK